jgi:hypothetical protein
MGVQKIDKEFIMLQGILIIVFMVLLIILMVAGKIPTLYAIPLLAIGIAIIGGLPLRGKDSILDTVIQDGSLRLASSYVGVLIATWLGSIMEKTKISETMIRKAAELAGDKTLIVALLLFAVTCALSSTMSGLGAVIMIGTIVIPILISVGVDKFTAGAIMLLAYGTGEHWGLIKANYFADVLKLDVQTTYRYCLIVAACSTIASIVYILWRFLKNGRKFAFAAPVDNMAPSDSGDDDAYEIKGWRGGLAMLTPLVPIFVVVAFKWPVIPSFVVAVLWALVWTSKGLRKTFNLGAKTCYEGFLLGAPCAALMIFIGMLLNAINIGSVKDALAPLINAITPTSPITFVLFFILLAPLVLYRGPLNMYGLGAGIAALMSAAGILSPMMVGVGFFGVSALQDTSCPTNTHNVWAAGFVEVDVTAITKRQLLFVWVSAAVAIIIGTTLFWS